MIIDYTDGIASLQDSAQRQIAGRKEPKTVKLGMFCTHRIATQASNHYLAAEAYPLGKLSIPVNRDAFRLLVGEQFRFTYEPYDLDEVVFRVLSMSDEDLENETITLNAIEDIYHVISINKNYLGGGLADNASGSVPGQATGELEDLVPFEDILIIEAPYAYAEDNIYLMVFTARSQSIASSRYVYLSIDGGSSYSFLGNPPGNIKMKGTTVNAITRGDFKFDNNTSLYVDFPASSVPDTTELGNIETTTRDNVISGQQNIALIGNSTKGYEFVNCQTVTPVSERRLLFTNIARARFDTERVAHDAGEEFWWIGDYKTMYVLKDPGFSLGTTRDFKVVPFSTSTGEFGDIAEASQNTYTFSARAKLPYPAGNLRANGSYTGRYTSDIVLLWTSRIRGSGAGIGDPNVITDAAPSIEFLYKIEVLVSSVIVRTVNNIDALTWTYTSAMNISDNGSLANTVVFRIYAVRDTLWVSNYREITVIKES